MARQYDASRRQEAARRTREAIVATAFRQHGEGVIDMESLAREANTSIATIRKYFPTREQLFEACTSHAFEEVPAPDPAAIAAIPGGRDRLAAVVTGVQRFQEELLGQTWVGYQLEQESPAMARAIRGAEALTQALARMVTDAWIGDPDRKQQAQGIVAGMLSPLTYRALRMHGGLPPEQATASTLSMLTQALEAAGLRPQEEVGRSASVPAG